MPIRGEIKRARELNRKGHYRYIWHSCVDCGKERWVQLVHHKPRSIRCSSCGKTGRIGERNNNWKGDSASYQAKHMGLYKYFGKADHCDINLGHKSKKYEWANINHCVSRNRADYIQLCQSCHRLFDIGKLELNLLPKLK